MSNRTFPASSEGATTVVEGSPRPVLSDFLLVKDNLEIKIMLNFLIFKYTQVIQIKNTKQHTIWPMSCQFWNLCIKSKLAGISDAAFSLHWHFSHLLALL